MNSPHTHSATIHPYIDLASLISRKPAIFFGFFSGFFRTSFITKLEGKSRGKINFMTTLTFRNRCNLDGKSLSEYFTLGGCLQGLRMVCDGLFGISLEQVQVVSCMTSFLSSLSRPLYNVGTVTRTLVTASQRVRGKGGGFHILFG